ncbi:hypothetical protein JOD18_004175 [Gracilibacillus alcaliphilus]|nr:hypothetical protein [Gracilibacillus alcaliphilus]
MQLDEGSIRREMELVNPIGPLQNNPNIGAENHVPVWQE